MNIIDDVGIFNEYYYKVLRIVIVIVPILHFSYFFDIFPCPLYTWVYMKTRKNT